MLTRQDTKEPSRMQETFSGLVWVVITRVKVYTNKPSVMRLGIDSAVGK